MSLSDDSIAFAAALNARAPQISLATGGQANSVALAILSVMNQIEDTILAAAPNISILTATGAALDALMANYGKQRNYGTPSVAAVQFDIPAAVTFATVIEAGTTEVQVPALGAGQPSFPFVTMQDAVIPIGSTVSNMVQAMAENVGVAGNVAANVITQMITNLGQGISVNNPNPVDGGTYSGALTVLGTDPQSDAVARGIVTPLLNQKYGALQIQLAVLAVPGVYDCYVVASGTLGTINIYWCAIDGTQPSGTQTLVDLAVRSILPVSFIPAYPTFTITQIVALAITYSAPATIQSAAIEPLIAQAVVNWITGLGGTSYPTPGLIHGTTIVVLQLATYVQGALGGALTDFKVTSSIGAASNTVVYRIAAGIPAITFTRV